MITIVVALLDCIFENFNPIELYFGAFLMDCGMICLIQDFIVKYFNSRR